MAIALVVICLNGVGVSYAHFTDRIDIRQHMETGEMKIEIDRAFSVHPKQGIENIDVQVNDEQFMISADVEKNYKGKLSFYVRNMGTIPIDMEGDRLKPDQKGKITIPIDSQFRMKKIKYSQWK
ncbi:hypothetical protein LCM20_14220 [Halobacillus litoralis]|uniref:hypothetical protein n=1 Tax=Halobacillus litoralis TaxID=45668 RepID=UPI001CD35F60|nr:hypothetical protein [Halobacillus litoralis]MCA0971759.1 hypothetical protein [Halobacillus litoralis]